MFHISGSENQIEHIAPDEWIDSVFKGVRSELRSAERKFPLWPTDLIIGDQVVNEEKGEATKALLDIPQGKTSVYHAKEEYIQTIAMCLRNILAIDRMTPSKGV